MNDAPKAHTYMKIGRSVCTVQNSRAATVNYKERACLVRREDRKSWSDFALI
jgi:hypothetical protein